MLIRMLVKISGGRGDGTDWPDPGGVLEVDDDEGAHLCAGRLATLLEIPGAVQAPADPGGPVVAAVVKPIVNSPKADWVEYAVAHGTGRAEAEAMKKTELIALLKES